MRFFVRWQHLAVLAAIAVACSTLVACGVPAKPAAVASPSQYSAPLWQNVLGGDQPQGAATWAALNNPANSSLDRTDASDTAGLARKVTQAQLSGQGTRAWPAYFPDGASGNPYGTCTNVNVLAASPARLPVDPQAQAPAGLPGGIGADPWAKVLVVWTAACTTPPYDPAVLGAAAQPPAVSYVYEEDTAGGWQPVREWQVPGSDGNGDAYVSAGPAPWELANLSACGAATNTQAQALIEVADAWDQMCAAAAAAGVTLTVTSALRTPAQQAALFAEAVKYYGSQTAARHWVAYADATTCTSRHCDGAAIDVAPTKSALGWLDAVVGCVNGSGVVDIGPSSCSGSDAPVLRLQRYGFASPLPYEPWYMEFALPLAGDPSSGAAACNPPASDSIPQMIAAIFACRLAAAGVPTAQVALAVAGAEVVGRCESGWNPDAEAFAGRYQSAPDPADGRTYTQEGVFMLSQDEADTYVPGGYANDTNPVDNINGAAAVYLSDSGWSAFGCATGNSAGFDHGPVLPAYGGPALPVWAKQYYPAA